MREERASGAGGEGGGRPLHPREARRTIGTAQAQKAPATAALVREMVEGCPDTLRGLRDRALLALGFAGAFRRSELVALTLGDVETVPGRGLRILVRRSKTDQHGAGQAIAVWANPDQPGVCPLAARTKPVVRDTPTVSTQASANSAFRRRFSFRTPCPGRTRAIRRFSSDPATPDMQLSGAST